MAKRLKGGGRVAQLFTVAEAAVNSQCGKIATSGG